MSLRQPVDHLSRLVPCPPPPPQEAARSKRKHPSSSTPAALRMRPAKRESLTPIPQPLNINPRGAVSIVVSRTTKRAAQGPGLCTRRALPSRPPPPLPGWVALVRQWAGFEQEAEELKREIGRKRDSCCGRAGGKGPFALTVARRKCDRATVEGREPAPVAGLSPHERATVDAAVSAKFLGS